jgi:inhibitor of KinA sporulation pathway (predicted exonuclease)
MTTEERFERIEATLLRIVATQEKMVDLMGVSAEGQHHFAAELAENRQRLILVEKMLTLVASNVDRMSEQIKGLLAIISGTVRRNYMQ